MTHEQMMDFGLSVVGAMVGGIVNLSAKDSDDCAELLLTLKHMSDFEKRKHIAAKIIEKIVDASDALYGETEQ